MASVDTPDDQLITVNYGDLETDDWAAKHQISLSEHASRLNAKQHFDNRGRQVWTEGFEETVLQWNLIQTGGGTVVRSTADSWRGGASALLSVPAVALATAGIERDFYNPLTGRYGFEFAWSCTKNDFRWLNFSVSFYDGTNHRIAAVRIWGATGIMNYYNSAAGWTAFGNVVCRRDTPHFWHKFKVVVDSDLSEYVRVLVDGQEYNLEGTPVWSGLSGNCPFIQPQILLTGQGTNINPVFIDDFIFSHLEP